MTSASRNPSAPRRGGLPVEIETRLRALLPDGAVEPVLAGLDDDTASGPDDLLRQLAGRILSAALEGEMTEHLGYARGESPTAGGVARNYRNGHTVKTVCTALGKATVSTPRDRHATFEPQLVAKRQGRVGGLSDRLIGMYAGGMGMREVETQLAEIYGFGAVRYGTIATITGAVLDDVQEWRARPLAQVYPVLHLDTIDVRTHRERPDRVRPCCLAVGVTCRGTREALGLWWQDGDDATYWLSVLSDLKRRGVDDVVVCCVDRVGGFREAVQAVFPQAWTRAHGDRAGAPATERSPSA